jgi:hypothetical protein
MILDLCPDHRLKKMLTLPGTGLGAAGKRALWYDGINVVPKRGQDGRKKLGTRAQQKTHAQ